MDDPWRSPSSPSRDEGLLTQRFRTGTKEDVAQSVFVRGVCTGAVLKGLPASARVCGGEARSNEKELS